MKSAEKITPRPARPRDVAMLAALFEMEFAAAADLLPGMAPAAGLDWKGIVKSFLSDPARVVLVVETQGRVVGYLHARVSGGSFDKKGSVLRGLYRRLRRGSDRAPDGDHPPAGIIENCFVSPEFRRNGMGRALVGAALDWFAAQRVRRITLGVLANNTAGVQFWQHCGFSTYRLIMQRNI